ncbi:MAG: thrombospondin type 3 repeat-containing protein [Agriterribacter sp.]
MRKIDAVLLSALIIYDYSAQSLVDSDASNLEQNFLSETTFQENKLADSYFSDNLFAEGEDNTVRSVRHIPSPSGNATEGNTISYHELAKINSSYTSNSEATNTNVAEVAANEAATETSASTVEISMPAATAPVAEAVETVAAEEATTEIAGTEATTVTYNVETVNTHNQPAAADLASFDTDGDGVYDYEDKCQGTAGVARFEGCPVPDNDADGVNDEEDRCPVEAGAAENGGCPVTVQETQPLVDAAATTNEAKEQTKNISRFTNLISLGFNGSVLSNEDFNIVLQFADVLIRQQEVKVEVSAAKDNTNINYLLTYLKELGVNNKQVIVSAKGADGEMDRSKVYMQLKL